MNLFSKCRPHPVESLKGTDLYPYFIPLDGSDATEVSIGGRRLIMLGSNNYLGLTNHPEVCAAASQALVRCGTSCTGSRFLNGTLSLHQELECRLAEFLGKERALLFSTGYQANLGVISALVGRDDIIIGDKENHASIVDGCRLSLGQLKRYAHNDLDMLERLLRTASPGAGKLVVVDGVFSMEGDIAPLRDIARLCRRYDARLMVDDAHGLGVIGPGGRGTAAYWGLGEEVDLVMGTFSKSLASIGGFVAGEARVINHIQHHARSLIFSASLPASCTAAALTALEILIHEPERVDSLRANGNVLRAGLAALGFETGMSETPIVPVIIGEDLLTYRMRKALFDAGVFTNAVVAPAVPSGSSRLRTSCIATHTAQQLQEALAVFAQIGEAMGLVSAIDGKRPEQLVRSVA